MNSFEKLKTKLAELFQLDQADLDFGIYRIMNARRDEITRFLESDLLPQVREALDEYKSSDKAEIQKELIKVIEGVKAAGMDPEEAPRVKENGELIIRFEYRPDGEKLKQDAINADTAKRVIADMNNEELTAWKDRLAVMWKRAGGKETDKTILDKHLFDYTRRNTFDYFIHKDLDGFLRRELDFYVKNEVMRLDDIEEESAPSST